MDRAHFENHLFSAQRAETLLHAARDLLFSPLPQTPIRLALAAVFVWSGATKLLDPASFAVIIAAYGLIPESWIMPVSLLLPALELAAGLGLALEVRGSLAVIAALLLLFLLILGYGVYLGLDVDCGCFGPNDPEADAYHGLRTALYRDAVMMAGVGYLYLWRRAEKSERQ